MSTLLTIVICAVVLAAAIVITAFVASNHTKKVFNDKIGRADEKARQIIDDALKEAEEKKRDCLL